MVGNILCRTKIRMMGIQYGEFMWALVVALIVAVLVFVFFKPKIPTNAPQTSEQPNVLDGEKIVRICGTVWLEKPTMLGYKPNGTVPIRGGGK